MALTLNTHTTDRSARVHITGDLDYSTTDTLVDAVARLLAEQPLLRDLHLDCSDLAFCDSAGLSGLLLVHRKTSAAGVRLHLDHRPAHVDRILEITCVLDHLTAAPSVDADESEIG